MTLDDVPVWAAAGALLLVLIAACELGARLHRDRDQGDAPEEGYLVSAALGLLALLLGFTFSLALDRYEQRRTLVVAEANAIGTAWLRADLMAEPARSATRELLVRYADVRLALAAAGEDARRIAAADNRAARLQEVIWAAAAPAAATQANAPLGSAMIGALTEVFDLGSERHAALRAHIPARSLSILALYAVITAAILGFATARGRRRHRVATTGLFALLSLTVGLILDLDRPRSGAITVDQSPLSDVRAAMTRQAA